MRERLLIPVCALLICGLTAAQEQTARNLQALEELEAAREVLDVIESEFGRDAMALIEPMEQLADRLMALNQFDDADALLDRAVQITRYHNGLHTPAQLGLIRKRIENFTNRQDWDSARDQMEYLFTYYLRVPVALNADLIDDFLVLAEQHLRGVTEDSVEEQGFHFNRSHQLNVAMIVAARQLHGEVSPILIPLLYRQTQHYYMFRKVFDNNGARNTAFKDSLQEYSSNGARARHMTRKDLKRIYYTEGLYLLNQISTIYAQLDPPNLVGQAMSELYLADWHNLFDFSDLAVEGYERAYALLIESGESRDRINAFFNQPRILPLQQFHMSLDEALTAFPLAESTTDPQLLLTEWTASIPTVRSPLNSFSHDVEETDYALMSVHLPAENEVSFLYSNRFPVSIGKAYDAESIKGFRELERRDRRALDRLEQLRFRPKMLNGQVIKSSSVLRYEISSEK
ncbi:MAG: hypothetical protein MI746_12350 [Pseudomonadales bacterium]|nr:hypothetical protein [Pseudomonadales bacterium]